jgi:3',5'-cyclic AMP phosphodiesterase CpdA
MPLKIAHLSDLHLGDDFIPRSLLRGRYWKCRAEPKIVDGLSTALRDLSPDYVVISGDFVNKSNKKQLSSAANYIRSLFSKSGRDLSRSLLLVPGNHDVSFFPSRHRDQFKRLRKYREFLQQLFEESDIEARRPPFEVHDPLRRVIFIAFDSTLKNYPPGAEGEIGTEQLEWATTKLRALKQQLGADYSEYTKIAIVRHHVVGIPGAGTSGERFMQLLDAADVMKTMHGLDFNLVLHGHKHYPHKTPDVQPGGKLITVIGAGTAMCPILEEQHGWGNNFNYIEVLPERYLVNVTLYKANGSGRFEAVGKPEAFPLTEHSDFGYSAKAFRRVVTVKEDGTKEVVTIREGVVVTTPGKVVKELPIQIYSNVKESRLANFTSNVGVASPVFSVQSDTVLKGVLLLRNPLSFGDAPITISQSYSLIGGTAMSISDLTRMYPPGREDERTSVDVSFQVQRLHMEVQFPRKFPAEPRLVVEHLGSDIVLPGDQYLFSVDKSLNRCSLEIAHPPLGHRVSVSWKVPNEWGSLKD